MKRMDYATALVMVVLCSVAMWDTRDLGFLEEFGPGPAFAPYLIAVVGIILSLVLAFEAYRGEDRPVEWPDVTGYRRVFAAIGLLILFTLCLPWLGFLITAAGFMLLLLLLILRRAVVPSLATTAVTVLLIQSVFVTWLEVRLPTGPFGF